MRPLPTLTLFGVFATALASAVPAGTTNKPPKNSSQLVDLSKFEDTLFRFSGFNWYLNVDPFFSCGAVPFRRSDETLISYIRRSDQNRNVNLDLRCRRAALDFKDVEASSKHDTPEAAYIMILSKPERDACLSTTVDGLQNLADKGFASAQITLGAVRLHCGDREAAYENFYTVRDHSLYYDARHFICKFYYMCIRAAD